MQTFGKAWDIYAGAWETSWCKADGRSRFDFGTLIEPAMDDVFVHRKANPQTIGMDIRLGGAKYLKKFGAGGRPMVKSAIAT